VLRDVKCRLFNVGFVFDFLRFYRNKKSKEEARASEVRCPNIFAIFAEVDFPLTADTWMAVVKDFLVVMFCCFY